MANDNFKLDDGFEEVPVTELDAGFEETPIVSTETAEEFTPTATAALNLADSATFGFADELEGAARAGLAKFEGDKKDLTQLYQEYKALADKRLQTASEQNPKAAVIGQVGGFLVPGTGVLGATSKAAKAAKQTSFLTKLIAGAKAGAKEGAIYGGLAGLGQSKANLLEGDVQQAATDVASGASLGAATGGTLAGLGSATGSALSGLTKAGLGKTAKKGFTLGSEKGVSLLDEGAAAKFNQSVLDLEQEIREKLFDKLTKNFEKKKEILSEATVNLDDIYSVAEQEIERAVQRGGFSKDEAGALKQSLQQTFFQELPDTVKNAVTVVKNADNEILSQLKKTTKAGKSLESSGYKVSDVPTEVSVIERLDKETGEFTATQIKEQFDAIKDGVMRGDLSGEEALRLVQDLQHTAFEKAQTDPTKAGILKSVAGKASDIVEAVNKQAIEPLNLQSSSVYKIMEDLKDIDPKVRDKASQNLLRLIQRSSNEINPNYTAIENRFGEQLKKALGEDEAAKTLEKLKEVSDDYEFAKRLYAPDSIGLLPTTAPGIATRIAGGIEAGVAKAANVAGLVSKPVKELAQTVAKPFETSMGIKAGLIRNTAQPKTSSEVSREVYNASDDEVRQYVQKLKAVKPEVAARLEKALNEGDKQTKNAQLFIIAQTPALRSAIGK